MDRELERLESLGVIESVAQSRVGKVTLSLSTVVLNSWGLVGNRMALWMILCFKNQLCNRLYPEKPAGMHWLGCNDG